MITITPMGADMKLKDFPLMLEFVHGAFTANSGCTRAMAEETDCYGVHPPDVEADPIDTQLRWDDAEQWLRELAAGCCETPAQVVRFVHWLGMEADSAMTIMIQDPTQVTDDQVKAPPYVLLDLYY